MIVTLTNVATIAAFLAALTFVGTYAIRTKWQATVTGRHVMAFMAVLLILLSLATAAVFFGRDWPGRDYIRFGAWSVLAYVMWWRVALLFRAQRESHDHHDRGEHHEVQP